MFLFIERVYKILGHLDLTHAAFIEIFFIPTKAHERDEVRQEGFSRDNWFIQVLVLYP